MLSKLLLCSILLLYISCPSLAFYSSSELENFNILLKPFGIDLTDFVSSGTINAHHWLVSNTTLNCTQHLEELNRCNKTSMQLVGNTTKLEYSALDSLSRSCRYGRFKCFQSEISKSEVLQGWVNKFRVAMHSICWDQCWKILLAVDEKCFKSEESAVPSGVLFMHEVLDGFCSEPAALQSGEEVSYCTDQFTKAALSPPPYPAEVCNVTASIEQKSCSSQCYEEVSSFYGFLDSCIGSVTTVMEKYRIPPSNKTFGVLIKNSHAWCGKKQPKVNTKTTPSSGKTTTTSSKLRTTLSPTSPGNNTFARTKAAVKTSSTVNGKVIAAIVVAVLVLGIAIFVIGRCIHQRIALKKKLLFEDYGYSRLKLMEEQEDYYYNACEDDEKLLDL